MSGGFGAKNLLRMAVGARHMVVSRFLLEMLQFSCEVFRMELVSGICPLGVSNHDSGVFGSIRPSSPTKVGIKSGNSEKFKNAQNAPKPPEIHRERSRSHVRQFWCQKLAQMGPGGPQRCRFKVFAENVAILL